MATRSKRTKLTAAEACVQCLKDFGVNTIFGIPGGHSLPIYSALAKTPGIRHVLGRHEQGLGYMADGYFRASGEIAAVSTTSGPAVANIAASVGEATTDTSAMLVIASAPASGLIGKNRGGLHDLNDQLGMMKSVARYWAHCSTPDEVYSKTAGLIENLRLGRPGGAFLEIPTDVMSAFTTLKSKRSPRRKPKAPNPTVIKRAAGLLSKSRRPLIILGTGAMLSGAAEAITKLAARLQAVISTTTLARGTVSSNAANVIFPDGASPAAFETVYGEADVILAVGTMFR